MRNRNRWRNSSPAWMRERKRKRIRQIRNGSDSTRIKRSCSNRTSSGSAELAARSHAPTISTSPCRSPSRDLTRRPTQERTLRHDIGCLCPIPSQHRYHHPQALNSVATQGGEASCPPERVPSLKSDQDLWGNCGTSSARTATSDKVAQTPTG